MSGKINKDVLSGEWIHSREEDTENEKVYRPADYDFPLSRRPRELIRLKTDGTLVQGEASESDSIDETRGEWELDDNDRLRMQYESDEKQNQTMKIVSIKNDKLVLKK